MQAADILAVAQLVVTVVLAIVTVIQAYVTARLNHRVRLLDVSLDQSLQRLHRAREVVTEHHKAYVYLREYVAAGLEKSDVYFEKHAVVSAFAAELRGLAFAIGDQELLDIVNNVKPQNENRMISEMSEQLRTQHLHTRLSQLLADATVKQLR